MIVIAITLIGLILWLATDGKPGEAGRLAYFAGLLALLLQYGPYLDSLLKR